MLQDAHKSVFKAIEEEVKGEWHVKDKSGKGGLLPSAKQRRSEVGEGGMYL